MPEAEGESKPEAATDLAIGEVVHDREDADPDDAFVLDLPDATVNEWTAYGETTVAEDNPEYPADAPVVVVAFEHSVRDHLADWDGKTALDVDDHLKAYYYSFPAPRLRSADAEIDATDVVGAADTSDADSSSEGEEDGEADLDDPEDEGPPEPSEATLALKERLEDAASVEVEDDGETLSVKKLGTAYRVRPGEVVEGDGPLRTRLESIVEDY